MLLQLSQFGSLPARLPIQGYRGIDCLQQILLAERLRQELDRPGLRRTVSVRQFPFEFQATRVRKLQVQDQASWRIGFFGFQEFSSGPECDYEVPWMLSG
jgi:hypothetical protein